MSDINWIKCHCRIHTKKIDVVHYGYKCSNCNKFVQTMSRYCPDCGGKYLYYLESDNPERSPTRLSRERNNGIYR